MAIYRNIRISFWTDNKISDDFSPEDKYFYLYLLTNPHTNLAGCYEISFKQASIELGYDVSAIKSLLKRFEKVHQVIRYSERTKEVLVLNWYKYSWTSSEKFRKPLKAEIDAVKEDAFKEYLLNHYNGIHTVSIPYGYSSDTTVLFCSVSDTDRNTDTVSDSDINKSQENDFENRFLKADGTVRTRPAWMEEEEML